MLQVVLFLDGRPGHEKQSKGILHALKKYVELNIHEVSVDKKGHFKQFLDWFLYFSPIPRAYTAKAKYDIVIGTGSSTHIPLLSWKKQNGGYAVTCMSPSFVIRNHFDVCFVPFHDRLSPHPNIIETIGPPNIASHITGHDKQMSMILVGGEDKRSHTWDGEKLLKDIGRLINRSREMNWTISSSPRTPGETDRLLRSLSRKEPDVQYVSFQESKPGWIEKQYAVNKSVWVTGDSISMVYEALSAGCCVGIIPVDWKRRENKFRYSLDYLIKSKRVITLQQFFGGESFVVETQPLNEADRCAREIVKRWWPEKLQ